ncbi:MAG: rhamnulokinase [Ruminococcus sp.]|nr:rhamnulokinase [Ruminococcus sp.]
MAVHLAIDLGASSGRAVVGWLENGEIVTEEIHRFTNDPVTVGDTMYWDVLRLFHEIKQSLIKAKAYPELASIGIDTWGVDFGLIGADGRLLENPIHYRDKRTNGMAEKCADDVSPEELYKLTGIQIMDINTVFQLRSLVDSRPQLLDRTARIMMMPDLLSYFLSDRVYTELSMASTTQMLDAVTNQWSADVLDKMNIPPRLLPVVVMPGTVVGELRAELCEELGIKPIKVVAVCGHDTQCAMAAAAPDTGEDFAFLSCGTWCLLGTQLDKPILSDQSMLLSFTNEKGYGGKTSFLKNLTGLWLIQESRRFWNRNGRDYSYADMEALAREATSQYIIDTDDPSLAAPGDIPNRISLICQRSGVGKPRDDGAIIRCIYDSLAMKFAKTIKELETCTEKTFDKLYIVGGGTKDSLLCELTEKYSGKQVVKGPSEATALGNLKIQINAVKESEHDA